MPKKLIFIAFTLVVVVSVVILYRSYSQPSIQITSYADCMAAGYPVLDSYPPQCRTPEGLSFTLDIGNELEFQDLIQVDNPRPNQIITSPLVITGRARGSWYFEATFPIALKTLSGQVISVTYAQADGDWMTSDFVPFQATLEFSNTESQGKLIIENSNPSGLPENAKTLIIPVAF